MADDYDPFDNPGISTGKMVSQWTIYKRYMGKYECVRRLKSNVCKL